jgi:hypothetical protein
MKKTILTLLSIAFITFSCDDKFDINQDPDTLNPGGVPLSKQLPAGMVGVAGAQGSYYALIGGFWSQFWTQSNASNQYTEIDTYIIGSFDYENGWTAMYDALGDIKEVKQRAETEGNWNYYLMATTLEVYASQIMSDLYDQTPYLESNNQEILQPQFLSGAETYGLMIADLKDALSKDLSASMGETPGVDDFLFGGVMTDWTKFANTVLLRLYMRQTEVNPDLAENGIKELIDNGAQFLDKDARITGFIDEANRSNPLYETDRRQLNTPKNLRASYTMYSFMDDNGDTRKNEFYGPGVPLYQGYYTNTSISESAISIVTLSPTTDVYFITKEESNLLQAEALERYYGGNGAKALYDDAVVEAFNKFNLDGTSFVAAGGSYEYPTTGTFDDKLKAIITQKWLASFPGNGFESFFEQNRTGYPSISTVTQDDPAYVSGEITYSWNGATGGLFPKRVVFPNRVITRNQNAPALVPITTPVWWDVN